MAVLDFCNRRTRRARGAKCLKTEGCNAWVVASDARPNDASATFRRVDRPLQRAPRAYLTLVAGKSVQEGERKMRSALVPRFGFDREIDEIFGSIFGAPTQ